MKLDPHIYKMVREMADDANCSAREMVEICVQTVYVNVMLTGVTPDQLKAMASRYRDAKKLSVTSTHSRPKKKASKGLTHSPFASLKDDLK